VGIHVYWEDEAQTIVCARFDVEWSIEEYHQSIDDIYALVTSVAHHVSLISDFTLSHAPPRQLLLANRHIESRRPSNSDVTVIVGANSFIQVLIEIGQKLHLKNFNIYSVKTMPEAYQIIKQLRQNSTV